MNTGWDIRKKKSVGEFYLKTVECSLSWKSGEVLASPGQSLLSRRKMEAWGQVGVGGCSFLGLTSLAYSCTKVEAGKS